MELEKIFTYYISDKDYYPKYARNSHNSVAKIKQYKPLANNSNSCDEFISTESMSMPRWYIIFTVKKKYYLN